MLILEATGNIDAYNTPCVRSLIC